MIHGRGVWVAAVLAAGLFVAAAPARAQSSFAGVVRDTQGAVMPGVTVEAASPVLIEQVRTVVTDNNGAYRIVDLRPGTYTLTFSLPGFNTHVREGVELPANFVATINVELSVGTLQESVTVSGAAPIVDVQTNAKQVQITRDVLTAAPTARTIQGLGQLVVGVTLNVPDVGGSRAMQQTYFAVRGQGGAQTVVLVDGLMTNGLMGDGAVNAYHNESMTQDAVYQTAGGNAETLTGGVNMNLVPKDGGNTFRGGFFGVRSPSSWQGDNLSDRLRGLGVRAVDRISNFYEWNFEQGGPIVRNKLWFFGAYRKARYDRPIANTFNIPLDVPNRPAAFAACLSGATNCEQGISDEKMDNPVVRLTWQMTERNKFAVYMDRALRLRGHAMGSNTDMNTASVEWNTPIFSTGSAKWTSTLSSRLLLENGFSFNRMRYDNLYQPEIRAERGTDAWFRNVRKNDVATGLLWNAPSAQLGNYPDRYNVQGALSFVTGTHNIKGGYQYQWGRYYRWQNANADLYQTYNNGVPFQVTVLNTPLTVQENLDANAALYIQDTWTIDRLTVNYGLRWDLNRQRIVGQPRQTGRFADVPAYDDIRFPTWSDWSPRLSVVYDLSGDGRTAVRAGFNRFLTAQTTGFAQLYNPTALTSQALPWTDLNGDDIALGERGCAYLTPGCEINFANLAANFGRRALSTFAPDIQRPYSLPFNVGFSHELFSGFSVATEYYRIWFRDITLRVNTLLDQDSWTRFEVANPLAGGTVPVWVLRPEFRGRVANLDSTSPDMTRDYNGVDITYNARLPRGIRAFGGYNIERSINNTCAAAVYNPNLSLYCDQSQSGLPWLKQFKSTVVYPLPWYGIQFSLAWQDLNGYLIGTAAQAYGGFTAGTGFDNPRGLGPFRLLTPANADTPAIADAMRAAGVASINVPLVAPETVYTPRVRQLDLSFSKRVQVRGVNANPRIDFFNALNSDDYSAVSSTQFGARDYLQPSIILQGRIIRIGVDMTW